MAQQLDFKKAVDSQYRLRNGKLALITGIHHATGNLMGVVLGEVTIIFWHMENGHSVHNPEYDIMTWVKGPGKV